jgi:hypothetical protein
MIELCVAIGTMSLTVGGMYFAIGLKRGRK